ncbi:FtsX-like permease family protein [Kitasatospora kifunensis]|uniref:Putative ABC transport system permease protein n=1 Tax=Kitasatospora kifunensis TaxID=58351 RepID=A0A7W7VVG9_KITKI|nr:FtsX-like permease family protein [Kitasatospora kifunensis]MBB4923684.1 putative ABC transport system permease protein [Kitasatospora kifunensis]
MKLTAWRVALRIARRDALRAKGRSALVLAMIALPILGVTGVDVVYRSSTLTAAEQADRQLGGADVLLAQHSPGFIVQQAPLASDGTSYEPPSPSPTPEQQRSKGTDPATLAAQLLPPGSQLIPLPDSRQLLADTANGLLSTEGTEADLTDRVWRGKLDLIRGQAPVSDQQIAVTQSFLDSSGLRIGGSTRLRGLGGGQAFTITGVVEYPDELGRSTVVTRPGVLPIAGPGADPADQAPGTAHVISWLVRLPAGAAVDWAAVQDLNKYGFEATSRSVVLNPPPRSQVPYYVKYDSEPQTSYFDQPTVVMTLTVTGMALLEIVLLAGPAFAVGARRSRRQLGLVAAAGGDRAQVRAVVLGGGVVLGVVGAAVGVVLAVLLVVVARPWAEPITGKRFGALRVVPLDLLGIVAVGLVTGLLAAVVPAIQAARQDVLAALGGRGGIKPPSRRLPLLGLVMLLGGSGLALFGAATGRGTRSATVLGGSMIAELGMVACTPMLIGLFGRLSRWLPLGPRLALRDSVRHRGRTAPAVAAVMAAVAGSVAVGVYTASSDAANREAYIATAPNKAVTLAVFGMRTGSPALQQLRGEIEQAMPGIGPRGDVQLVDAPGDCTSADLCGTATAELPSVYRCPLVDVGSQDTTADSYRQLAADPRCHLDSVFPGRFGSIVSGDSTALHNLLNLPDGPWEQAVADGKVLVFDPRMLQGGKALIRLQGPTSGAGPTQQPTSHDISVDAVLAPVPRGAANMFMSPQTATRLGLTRRDVGSVWLPAAMPSRGAEQAATAAVVEATGNSWNLRVERGYQPQSTALVLGLSVFAALVALGAAGIATGLASADSQRDLATLAAVGAAPRIRRSLSGFQCGVIAAMGALLGTVCGIVPAVALRRAQAMNDTNYQSSHAVIDFPWTTIALTLIVLPLLATLLAMLVTRSRITLVRRVA